MTRWHRWAGAVVPAILALVCVAMPARAQAPLTTPRQYYSTLMSWFETNAVVKFGGGFGSQLDLQVRTAADQEGRPDRQAANVFANPFQFLVRPWVFYDLGTTGVRFSLSPFAYGATWTYYDGGSSVAPEVRTSLQVQYGSRAGKVYLTNRLRYEFRWTALPTPVPGGWSIPGGANDGLFSEGLSRGRWRYMIRAWVPLGRKDLDPGTWYLATYNELFIGMGQDVRSSNLLDQNRFYIGIGHQQKHKIRWEVGYMNQFATKFNRPPDFNNVEVNHILATWLFFDDLGKVF